MKALNSLIHLTMPLLPRKLVGMVARRYIAGVTLEEALKRISQLNRDGFLVTMDVLGESAVSLEQTLSPVTQYLNVLDAIDKQGVKGNISLKLSQLGLHIDRNHAWNQLLRILNKARNLNIFVRIDMEDSSLTDATLDMYRRAREFWPEGVGVVIQAYLHRSGEDVKALMADGTNLRICKGIYKESPAIAFKDKSEIRQNAIRLIRRMLDDGQYVAIASHDLEIIRSIREYCEEKAFSKDRFEFQSLLGVPIDRTLQELRDAGYTVRYYVPFGTEWYAYASRRVLENPDIGGYVFRDFFSFRQK